MFKRKCPVCGARNDKERMVCIECGAPLTSEPAKLRVAHVPTEDEEQAEKELEKAPEEKVEDEGAEPPGKSVLGKFFFEVKETFRDSTRDDICAGLQRLGIDARLAERGRVEEKFGGKSSPGLIEIPEGPIRWVNVRKETRQDLPDVYYTDYGVPDPRLEPNFSKTVRIKSVRKKNFPLLGEVVDLRWELLWEGEDFGLAVINRLNSDFRLKEPIMKSRDVTIDTHGDHSCWIISTKTRDPPSEELWDCYQKIAQHLLAEWSSSV